MACGLAIRFQKASTSSTGRPERSWRDFVAQAHNTSGLAVGGGFLWIGCNGAGTAAAKRPFDRPFDRRYGEVVKCDMKTGKQVWGYKSPWGGTHGTTYVQETDKLWVIAPTQRLALETDPKDGLRMLRMVSLNMDTPHGVSVVRRKTVGAGGRQPRAAQD